MPAFTVQQNEVNFSLLDFLQQRIPAAPPSYLKQLIKKGKVRGPGGPLEAKTYLLAGSSIQLPDSERLHELLAVPQAQSIPLQILYESREMLIVDKPSGLAIHSSQGHETDNLTSRAETLLTERGLKFKIAPVHRLDLETSGPVLFGKGKQACGQLGQLFMQRKVDKYYQALVVGKTAGSGRIDSTLSAKGKVKQACTDYRALLRSEQASLLELQLHTGRQHQIRKQLADLGHPLFGDKRYSGPTPAKLPRLFLHCCRLAFIDPFSATPVEIVSPLPDDLAEFLAYLKFDH